jgi:hypothetical protein
VQQRFQMIFGTGQPLRLPETSLARLDLVDLPAQDRSGIESENLRHMHSQCRV